MTRGIRKLGIMKTLSIIMLTFSVTKISIMTFSITTLSIATQSMILLV